MPLFAILAGLDTMNMSSAQLCVPDALESNRSPVMSQSLAPDFVPRKSAFGARLVAGRDPSVSAAMRRLLLLADGQRTVFTLMQLMPERDVATDLLELMQRGLIEDPEQLGRSRRVQPSELPDGWATASSYMATRARESLGVSALDVVSALEQATSPDAAREAMSQWYRAMRNSRGGREQADQDRVKAALLMQHNAGL